MFFYQILSILRKLTADFSNTLWNSLDEMPKQSSCNLKTIRLKMRCKKLCKKGTFLKKWVRILPYIVQIMTPDLYKIGWIEYDTHKY